MDVEQDQSATTASPNIHPDYDFDDGNIILSVTGKALPEDPTSLHAGSDYCPTNDILTYLFRVHKSVLKRHSQTFTDMLTLSLEDGPSASSVGGLPVVPLQDEPLELIRLLQVIYYSDSVPHEPFKQKTFNFFASVLKLADKYDMPRLTEKFIPRIQSEWPSELYKWDAIQDRIRTLVAHTAAIDEGDPADFLVDPATVVRFGVDSSYSDILPSAYYALLTMPPRKFPWASMEERWFYAEGGRIGRYDVLGPSELLTLYTGSNNIRQWVGSFAETYDQGEGGCRTAAMLDVQERCIGIKQWWQQNIKPLVLTWLTGAALDPLEDIERLTRKDLPPSKGLCFHCFRSVYSTLGGKRADFWKELPGFFDVKPAKWDEQHGWSQLTYDDCTLG